MKHLKIAALVLAALLFFQSSIANALVSRLFCVDSTYSIFVEKLFGKTKLKSDEVVYIDIKGSPDECPNGMETYSESVSDFMADQRRERLWALQSVSDQVTAWAVREAALVFMFFLTAFVLGQLAESGRMNANHTRKFLGIGILIAPMLAPYSIPEATNSFLMLASFAVFLGCLLLFVEPIRNRSPILQSAFAAIDRPEDQPHTLKWFTSAYIASSAIILWAVFLGLKQNLAYVRIPTKSPGHTDLISPGIPR